MSKVFAGGSSPAVDGLTLEVPVGEVLALVGPSGCGKTTTLRMINRLIEPTAGRITVLGEDHRTLPAHELRRRIGYVIQQIGLFPHHRVRRNIGAVLELLKWPQVQIDTRIEELIDLVGLDPELLDRYPGELSGGQTDNAACIPGLRTFYDLDLSGNFLPLDGAGPITVAALLGGEIDVAILFSTAGVIAQEDWVVLADDRNMIKADNIIPVLSQALVDAHGQGFVDLVNTVSATLDTPQLTELNRLYEIERADADQVARDWLIAAGLIPG